MDAKDGKEARGEGTEEVAVEKGAGRKGVGGGGGRRDSRRRRRRR